MDMPHSRLNPTTVAALLAAAIGWAGLGCTPYGASPRVVAERLFPDDGLGVCIGTYGHAPNVAPHVVLLRFHADGRELPPPPLTVSDEPAVCRPGVEIAFAAPEGVSAFTMDLLVHHGGRRFAVTIPFQRTGLRGHRWLRDDERVEDLGPLNR